MPLNIRDGKLMHEHDSRTARVIERTLKNGIIHPDVLHSFQSGRSKQPARQDHTIGRDLAPDPSLTDFDLFVQHSQVTMCKEKALFLVHMYKNHIHN